MPGHIQCEILWQAITDGDLASWSIHAPSSAPVAPVSRVVRSGWSREAARILKVSGIDGAKLREALKRCDEAVVVQVESLNGLSRK
jgi:hypothetical protein